MRHANCHSSPDSYDETPSFGHVQPGDRVRRRAVRGFPVLGTGAATAAATAGRSGCLARRRSPEIELNLVNLPTTLSLRRHRSYFRLTHRFARDLRRGDFGQLAEDLFSLDNGAIIGLEYRFGITSDLQAGVHRSLLSKTIQVFGRYDAWKQGDKLPVSISVIAIDRGPEQPAGGHAARHRGYCLARGR